MTNPITCPHGALYGSCLMCYQDLVGEQQSEIERLRVERDFARRELDRACQETREALSREVAAVRSTDEPSVPPEVIHRICEAAGGKCVHFHELPEIGPCTIENCEFMKAALGSNASRGEAGDRAGPLVSPSSSEFDFERIREDYQALTGVCPLPGPSSVKSTAEWVTCPKGHNYPSWGYCRHCYPNGEPMRGP